MPIAPLCFTDVKSLAAFLKVTNVQNFVLLGKQNVLIARLTDVQFFLAQESYGATVEETPEVLQLIKEHFGQGKEAVLS